MGRRALPVLIFFLSCGPKFDEDKAREEIREFIASQHQDWFSLTESSEALDSTLVDTIPKIAEGDSVLERWWRDTDTYGTIVSISFDRDTVAYVTVVTDLRGALHFSIRQDTVDFNEQKFIIDLAYRYAIFYKDAAADSWRLQAVSWAEIISDTILHPTVNISEIELNGKTYLDTTLNHLWPIHEIVSFSAGDSVLVRLKTYEDTTASVAFLHAQGRKRFVPDGTGKDTWVASFVSPATPGTYRLVLSLVNRRTFFDAHYPYNSNRWVINYEVK